MGGIIVLMMPPIPFDLMRFSEAKAVGSRLNC